MVVQLVLKIVRVVCIALDIQRIILWGDTSGNSTCIVNI